MAEYTISLPESLYHQVIAAAKSAGKTPVEWIAQNLPTSEVPKPTSTFPMDLVGVFDSSVPPTHPDEVPHPVKEDDLFGQYVIEKMAKQGIHIPPRQP